MRKSGNLTFRLRGTLRDDLEKAADRAARSLSEEIEARLTRDFAWEAAQHDIGALRREAAAQVSAARVAALRAAGLMILRDAEGRPTRVVIDLETLLAEADGLARGLRSGFIPPDSPPPEPPRPMTTEEAQTMLAEIKRALDAAASDEQAA